ncbi:MAG: hypothetical protein JWN86_2089 [Planctomycetota bacterium]|nr:hypothetical protein [Planctomycetota bacterium]
MSLSPRLLILVIPAFACALVSPASGQTTAIDKLKAMGGDLDALDAKNKKDKDRPPFEFFRSQITPFDVLPYVKRNHWSTLNMEMQANLADYDGYLQTSSETGGRSQIRLFDMPHAMIFRREARLQKEQRSKLGLQIMMPEFMKELSLELTRPDAIRPEALSAVPLMRLETHQMIIPILSPEPSLYGSWTRFQATLPTSGDRDTGSIEIEKQRYYRLVLPQTPKPALSSHPLTWTNTSHLVWDSLTPESLNSGQQQALIDWLHFGGQLIIIAAGPTSIAPLQDSFLRDYLPATASGKNATLSEADLKGLSDQYPPPLWPAEFDETLGVSGIRRNQDSLPPRYKPPEPIRPAAAKPVFVAGLEPKPGATVIPLGDPGGHPLGVEWRVGRGRVLMLAVNPNDPAFSAWLGMDSLVRRVFLRRVEEPQNPGTDRRIYGFLSGPELTWFRLIGRDLGAQSVPDVDPGDPNNPIRHEPVAAWLDTQSELPVKCRTALELASGITIPASTFVLKVILAYILVLVPLNWMVCRFVFRRRELAWVAVPILALGFAVAVERAAAYDMGFDSDCTEIDVLELQGPYPRGHLSRFAAIYSTGRDRYTIAYPNDPSALALPLNMKRAMRGEDSAESVFESFPEPALKGFQVQPRSLSMFRAEAIVNLPGGIVYSGNASSGKIENGTNLDLHDAALIDIKTGERTVLGTIGAGESVNVRGANPGTKAKPATVGWTDPSPFLKMVEAYRSGTPEERGELRLVAWAPDPHPGQKMTPKVDRHRGFRLIVAHLQYGPPPDPGGVDYYKPVAAH